MLRILTAASIILAASAASAQIDARFDEGAPKDRFTITNSGNCTLTGATVTVDLASSQSGLIFDVTGQGAGVEVFQPLEFVAGQAALKSIPKVRDGDNQVTLSVASLAKGQSIAFTIDVDDTMGGREITVSGSEIKGAAIAVSAAGKSGRATFGENAKAAMNGTFCS